jgi:hypothetical protein
MKHNIYLHCQDFVDAIIGPFESFLQAMAHHTFQLNRGDSGKLIGVYVSTEEMEKNAPSGCLRLTPERDRALQVDG